MLELIDAHYISGYKIHVCFNDGSKGAVDLKESLWGPVFEELKDKSKFKNFSVSKSLHTIAWDNDADLAPEYIHKKMVEQNLSSGH